MKNEQTNKAMEALNIMKTKFIMIVLAIFVMSFGISFGQSITLENITGTMWHGQPDSIMAGSTYTFNLRVTGGGVKIDTTFYGDPNAPDSIKVDTTTAYTGIANGFTVYSPDGAAWTTTVGDTLVSLGGSVGILAHTQFDIVFAINPFSTGSGADTVGFGGVAFSGTGLVADFDDIPYSITIGPITGGASAHGKTICLDSAFYRTTGEWVWASLVGIEKRASWDGPHCYTVVDEATDFEPIKSDLPRSFALSQNYPNPFNPTTTIKYDLPKNSDVSLTIYNVTGQKVSEFNQENQPAGSHIFNWDATKVSSGVYFYKLTAGDFTATKKMMLLK